MKRNYISFGALLVLMCMLMAHMPKAFAEGNAPVAENLELKTYRGVTVSGKLSAYDPDGDVMDYIITTKPVKGEIEVNEDGSFIYTPAEGKKGRDYFGYKAVDSLGNASQEATVIIKIEKQSKAVVYSDMKGRADEYSAVYLSEMDIFTGEQIGGKYCFMPEKEVSRGEFLTMCMIVSGKPVIKGVFETGLSDDMEIPSYARNYVGSAVMCGLYNELTVGHAGFDSEEIISESEAALLLDKTMNLTDAHYLPDTGADYSETIQACMNLSACNIIDMEPTENSSLTRAEMARMFSGALEIVNRR